MRSNVEFQVDLPKTNLSLIKPHLQRHVATRTKNTPDKINVNAACNLESSFIVVVARDWRREVVFACSKRVNTTLPFQAEVEAII